jgi:AraC family transcriptional regulator of adaptative response/methylated-DNA-[protein]-cysteine methyltransferase
VLLAFCARNGLFFCFLAVLYFPDCCEAQMEAQMSQEKYYDIFACVIADIALRAREGGAAPSLEELAGQFGLSQSVLQKKFSSYVGVSPMNLMRFLRLNALRPDVQDGQACFDVAIDHGLSGGGRLHDLCVRFDGVTPGELARSGGGLSMVYGCLDTLLGGVLIAIAPRGISWVSFYETDDVCFSSDHAMGRAGDKVAPRLAMAEVEMRQYWAEAEFKRDDDFVGAEIDALRQNPDFHKTSFGRLFAVSSVAQSASSSAEGGARSVPLFVKGSDFQLKVWRALLDIPHGATSHYGALAKAVGKPKAARAIGNAVGANPISMLIPCHRVLQSNGIFGGYRWGLARKKILLGMECADSKI